MKKESESRHHRRTHSWGRRAKAYEDDYYDDWRSWEGYRYEFE